jgi:cyclohexanecarboxylate-CoA ligase
MIWPTPSFPAEEAEAYRRSGAWNDRLITDYLDHFAVSAPHRLAFIDSRGKIDYLALQSLSYRLADGLLRIGVRPGDVVAIQLPNWIEFAALHVALVRLNCLTCLITPTSREREVASMLRIARAQWLVIPDQFRGFDYVRMAANLRLASEAPPLTIVVGDATAGMMAWTTLLAGASDSIGVRRTVDECRPCADDISEIVFTSGTTGVPKGVMHTHNTLLAPQLAMAHSLKLSEGVVLHMASTLAHQTGFLNGIRLPLQIGGTAVLQDVWRADAFAALIEEHRIEVSSGSATFLLDLLRSPSFKQHDLSSLRIFRCGGGPIPVALVREAEQMLPHLKVLRGWGQTENGVVTITRLDDPLETRAETDGTAQPGMEVRVVDAANMPVPVNTEGRLQTRGAAMSPAYANSPELMREHYVDSWFETGDLATLNANGYIRITGRVKDIVIRGGENIPVHYVENVLFEDLRILEVAIVGMPDPRLGERCCAFVICRPGATLDLESLREFLSKKGVATQYWPERLEVVDSLPRSANGKVQKAMLRATFNQ